MELVRDSNRVLNIAKINRFLRKISGLSSGAMENNITAQRAPKLSFSTKTILNTFILES